MKSDTRKKLITCIVPHGRALPVLKALQDEYGIITVNIYRARGTGRMTPLAWRGLGETTEKDIMSVVVDEDKSEEIFGFIYESAAINQPHGGIIFQQGLRSSTDFSLPEIPVEE
jgi:nitrogen regulatory protein PII